FAYFGGGQIGPIPVPVIIMFGIFGLFAFIMSRTVWGRSVYVSGGNPQAAYLSGIPVQKVRLEVYIWAGILYAVAGIIEAGLLDAATASAGTTLVLTPIAAVVIGGVSLVGGVGSLWGTLLGALTLGVLTNGLDLLNVSPYYSQVIYGLVVFLAVLLDAVNRKNKAETPV
ncbi:MAG: ABC transporter permease, partial [Sulfobacillus thermotolerans]|nr:ABC transporter permease [Sulfobacillus thermotolerans]